MNFVNMLILIYILLSVLEIDSIRVGLLGLFHLEASISFSFRKLNMGYAQLTRN